MRTLKQAYEKVLMDRNKDHAVIYVSESWWMNHPPPLADPSGNCKPCSHFDYNLMRNLNRTTQLRGSQISDSQKLHDIINVDG